MFTLNIALAVLVLDQLSKMWILSSLSLGKSISLFPTINLMLAYNQGAAFGIFATAGGWQRWFFIALAFVFSIGLWYWAHYMAKSDRREQLAIALLLGGALGNMIDRIRYGHVIDFIDFYIGNWHWYTFNIADAAICVGAAILMLLTIMQKDPKAKGRA